MAVSTLSEFTAKIHKTNISRPYLFYVEIMPPEGLVSEAPIVNMFCHGANTPHTSFLTNRDYQEAGVRRKFVYDWDNQNLMLRFYLDQEFNVKYFFDLWCSKIVINKRNFGYYDDYTARFLNVYIIDLASKETYKYKYNRAVPVIISNIDMSYRQKDINTFDVEFVFENVEFLKLDGEDKILFASNPEIMKLTSDIGTTYNPEYLDSINGNANNPLLQPATTFEQMATPL
jgi:hypothetical protein